MTIMGKRNLRPYVLGGCFFCGLLAGFIAYSDSQSAASRFERERQQQEQVDRERREQAQREKSQKKEEPQPDFVMPNSERVPDISAEAIAPIKLEEEIELVKSPDWKTPPPDGIMTINPRVGLSVATATPPLAADRIDAREMLRMFNQSPASAINASPPISASPTVPTAPINSRSRNDDDLPLPDLE